MEGTQETNQQTPATSISQTEPKKVESTTVPRLTSEELYNKALTEIRQCLSRSKTSYLSHCIQSIFKRTNYRYLSDLQFHCLVIEIQTLFHEYKIIPAQMAAIRMYHQMIVLFQRARTYIAGVLPIMFVETISNVKDENMFYFVKELKALYRIWHGYMDMYFLRKVRDQSHLSCGLNIMDIDLTDKYIVRQLSKIKHSQYIAQRIISGNAEGFFPNGPNQKRPMLKPKFNSWKKKNNSDKDETLSNQTVGLSEQKQKGDTSINDLNEILESQENGQSSNIQLANNSKVTDGKQQKETQVSNPQDEKDRNKLSLEKEEAKVIEEKCDAKEDKVSKLKGMYELLMSKKRRRGNKLLVQSGAWQFCEDIIQILKQKTFKKEIYQIINTEIEQEEEEWIYPEHKFNGSREDSDKPFSFVCKFCDSKLQVFKENDEQYFKDIVCFQMRKEGKKHSREMPCFHLKAEIKGEEGLFLLHKECFLAARSEKIDEKKWKLE